MAHALLGPSGAKRWMSCTPSARFEEQFEDKESIYAREGTAAHEYGELLLLADLSGGEMDAIEAVKQFTETNEFYNQEMEEAVGLYVEIVEQKYRDALERDESAMLFIEERVDFSQWVPEGFGTGDVVIIADGTLEIIDLKYGKGVAVDAEDNPQLRLYGLGAFARYRLIYDIDEVVMTIVQPRLGSVSSDDISAEDLILWAETEVKPAAEKAWSGEGEFKSGEHCKFCKAKPRCKALAERNLEMAKYDFALPHELQDEEIADILGRLKEFDIWIKAVKEYALDQAENHEKQWPGWKLVEGRSNRVITDADECKRILIEDGVEEALLYKPRQLEGLGKLEKLVGKKHFNELMPDGLIIKPPGKPTLVEESDKRPAISSAARAAADFAEVK